MKNYDVVVIGGGPIGSSVAERIASNGASVLVIERKDAVGYPNHCSGMVSKEFTNLVAVPNELILNHIKGAEVFSAHGNSFSFKRDMDFAIVIDRVKYDKYLYELAIARGANYIFKTQLKGYQRCIDRIELLLDSDNIPSISTKIVVVAAGATSSAKRMFGFVDEGRDIQTIQLESTFTSYDPDIVYVYMDNSISNNWFSWVIPIGRNRARIGFGTDKPGNLPVLFEELTSKWKILKGKELKKENPVVWHIPTGLVRESVKDNVMLVGDSARQVKPFSGGGLYTGILSSYFAADAAVEALKLNNYSKEQLMRYEYSWRRTVGKEIKREFLIRDVYKTLTDEDKDNIIKKLNGSHIKEIINTQGFIDEPWRAGLRIITSAGIPLLYLKRKLFMRK